MPDHESEFTLGPALVALIEKQVQEKIAPVLASLRKVDEVFNAIDTAVRLLNADGHGWSSRPCQTCSAVTQLFGQSFGCVAYAERRERDQQKTTAPSDPDPKKTANPTEQQRIC